MWAEDFQFDGQLASSYGLMLCSFSGNNDYETNRNGADIEFTTIKTPGSNEWKYICSQYTEVLTSTFEVCKQVCGNDENKIFTVNEQRNINRWLNRKDGFHEFRLVRDGFENIYFEAQINVKKIEYGTDVIGFEITVTTNRPFATFSEQLHNFRITEENNKHVVIDISDDIGYVYPYLIIKPLNDGELIIDNSINDQKIIIKDCTKDEIITYDCNNRILLSSKRDVSIMDSFNFKWLKIENTKNDKVNTLAFSLPCDVILKFKPICKIGF